MPVTRDKAIGFEFPSKLATLRFVICCALPSVNVPSKKSVQLGDSPMIVHCLACENPMIRHGRAFFARIFGASPYWPRSELEMCFADTVGEVNLIPPETRSISWRHAIVRKLHEKVGKTIIYADRLLSRHSMLPDLIHSVPDYDPYNYDHRGNGT